MDQSKPFYLSKTLWVQVIGILVLVLGTKIPGVTDFLKSYFAELGAGWAIVNTILRLVTKDKLEIT